MNAIDRRLQQLALFDQATGYSKQKDSLQNELENFISSLPGCPTLATVTSSNVRPSGALSWLLIGREQKMTSRPEPEVT